MIAGVSITTLLLVLAAGVGAGFVGYAVGASSLISYPALLAFGIPPVLSNTTNTVGVCGTGIGGLLSARKELKGQGTRVAVYACIGLVGGIIGGLLLLDLKDLRSMLQFVGDNAAQFRTKYGNISMASIGAIQRGLLVLENQGGDKFFGEPMLNIHDLMQTSDGKGVVNILAADKLMQSPMLYATFLLWILSELYENLPEAGDLEKPKLVFFFDEAHMLFNDAPQVLIDKVEQVVRLIRSKGVGVFFVTQSPADIPEKVLSQLGNRVQHALRAFTPRDQKAVRTVAETMRPNPKIDMVQAIQELGVGEALVSFLDDNGTPGITQRVWVCAPGSQIGPIAPAERQAIQNASVLKGVYDKAIDRVSAYEVLQQRGSSAVAADNGAPQPGKLAAPGAAEQEGPDFTDILMSKAKDILLGSTGPRGGHREGIVEKVVRQSGEKILRGILGSLLGGKK